MKHIYSCCFSSFKRKRLSLVRNSLPPLITRHGQMADRLSVPFYDDDDDFDDFFDLEDKNDNEDLELLENGLLGGSAMGK